MLILAKRKPPSVKGG